MSRLSVPALDKILGEKIEVLDYGFIRLVDYMGGDDSVVQAARVSYGDGTKGVREDAALIDYLIRHGHTSPLEMCSIKLHVKLPIFVARQWIRHRTAKVNELSARYSELPAEWYTPSPHQIRVQSTSNRQGRGDVLRESSALAVCALSREAACCHENYRTLLDLGVARELSRIGLPLSTYTEWYWKIDLHNLMHFLELRLDHHAQYEIRVYAEKIMEIVDMWVPACATSFRKHRLNGARLSGPALDAIRRIIDTDNMSRIDDSMSDREWNDLIKLLGGGGASKP